MRSFGGRVLIGLGILAAAVMTVGYAFIFSDIANPPGRDRAILNVPATDEASATMLDDGRPVFVVNDPRFGINVLDAQAPEPQSGLGVAVQWCTGSRTFVDPVDGSAYEANGDLLSGSAETGLVAFSSRPAPDDPSRMVVGADSAIKGGRVEHDGPTVCPILSLVAHEPDPDEIFDPSVAVDQEPPGWIWVEGTLSVDDAAVRLCDGSASACETSAEVRGIDPAGLQAFPDGRVEGQFIGRVRDGALEGLIFVPDIGDAS